MELRQLRQFVLLSETLNFRIAAERLNMAQPPFSVSIRKLEEEIGAALFERSTHSVTLTEAGRAALPDARRALFHAAETMRIARATNHGLAGRLRIGFVGTARYALLPRLLPAFRAAHPEVVLDIVDGSNADIIDGLESSAIDLGLVRVPLNGFSGIRHAVIDTDRFVVALPAGHRLARSHHVTVDELIDEPFVHYAKHKVPGLHALSMMLFHGSGRVPPLAQEAVQVDTVICLVASGLGVALVPSVAARQNDARVVFREVQTEGTTLEIGLAIAYHPDHENAAARRFREIALQHKATMSSLNLRRY